MVFNMGSYWLPNSALPARMTLIITTFLSNIVILQRVNEQTVRIPTTTSLQMFALFSVLTLVTAMIQYLFLLHHKSHSSKRRSKRKAKRKEKSVVAVRASIATGWSFAPLSNDEFSMDKLSFSGHGQKIADKEEEVHPLDQIFRYLAPGVYTVFCTAYFGYYYYQQQISAAQ